MRMDAFDIFARAEVPHFTRLVPGAAGEYRLVGRVPNRPIDRVLMCKPLFWPLRELSGVPETNCFVKRSCQHHSLIDVVPLNPVDLALMAFTNHNGSLLLVY